MFSAPWRDALARALSIVGHPFVLMPLASVSAAHGSRASGSLLAFIGGATLAFVAAMLAWSIVQVRRGRWRHVDASERPERAHLNRVLLLAFMLASLLCAALGMAPVAVASLLAAAIVATALLLSGRLKVSLHVAFAAFAALLCAQWPLTVGIAALAFALAWARVHLGRHGVADVVTGAIAGALAGIAYRLA